MTLPFFFFWSFYIYFLKIFESWVLFTFISTSYIWLLSSERAPKILFSKMVTDIEASEISRFREPLHVSNVSAFREKWRKWQSVRNALRIPGFIVQINKLIVPLNKNIHCRASFYHSRQLCRSMNPKHAKPSFGALGPTKHWGRKGRVYSIKLLIYPHSNIGDTSFMVAKETTEALTSPPFLHILQCLVSALLIGKTCTLSTCCFFHLRWDHPSVTIKRTPQDEFSRMRWC